jgi:branched-subunit amino acid aminotransferase/4-amino-4-deoxychorismate lyase
MAEIVAERVIGDILVDGALFEPSQAKIPVLDIGMQRGFGCFEALRSYSGRPFRSGAHLERLAASARKLGIPGPDPDVLAGWIADRSAAGGDCVVRVYLTGGLDPARPGQGSTVVVYAEPLSEDAGPVRLLPLDAPWHADGAASELTGAKTLSYGPNLAASLAAQRAGYDDALLIGRSGSVLEGPTYGVAWVSDGVLETPIPVSKGRFPLQRMLAADEALALSTVKEIMPVGVVGDRHWEPGPVTARLGEAFNDLVAAELATA